MLSSTFKETVREGESCTERGRDREGEGGRDREGERGSDRETEPERGRGREALLMELSGSSLEELKSEKKKTTVLNVDTASLRKSPPGSSDMKYLLSLRDCTQN